VAKEYLLEQGYKVIAQNYSCSTGEVDVIAREGRWLVFVEVRTKTLPARYGGPFSSIGRRKQLRLQKAALNFLQTRGKHLQDCPIRFDVVGILVDDRGRVVKTDLIPNAFAASPTFYL